jgi:hypothetical protein
MARGRDNNIRIMKVSPVDPREIFDNALRSIAGVCWEVVNQTPLETDCLFQVSDARSQLRFQRRNSIIKFSLHGVEIKLKSLHPQLQIGERLL